MSEKRRELFAGSNASAIKTARTRSRILRTDDRSLILMTYRGVRHASAGADDRIARGEQVEASEYYLRTAPFFETSSPKYAWLNKIVSVGVGERRPDGVTYEIFEIL
jgi:hypothetical protein